MRTGVSAVAALTAWLGLALQLVLIVNRIVADGGTVGLAVWRFVGFFTILTNLGVAIVATAMALRPDSELAGPRVRLATAASIAAVGIVYSVALRATWHPTGWQKVADHVLHDATPPLFLLAWILSAHGRLGWRDALWGVLPGVAYCVYALARGAVDGWYAYWFLDPKAAAPFELARNIVLLSLGFFALAILLVAIDRWLGRRREPALQG
jgi:hypothetical protein